MEKIQELKGKIVLYVKKHKCEIVSTSITTVLFFCMCNEKYKSKSLKLKNNDLKKRHSKDANKILSLKKENHYLKELCKEKDEFFSKAISESMRLGGSFGGQQMAYKRWGNYNV